VVLGGQNGIAGLRALANDEQVDARHPGAGKLAAIENAPGTYVKSRLGESTPVLETTVLPEVAQEVAAPETPVPAVVVEATPEATPVVTEATPDAAPSVMDAEAAPVAAAPKAKKAPAKKPAKPKKV